MAFYLEVPILIAATSPPKYVPKVPAQGKKVTAKISEIQ